MRGEGGRRKKDAIVQRKMKCERVYVRLTSNTNMGGTIGVRLYKKMRTEKR